MGVEVEQKERWGMSTIYWVLLAVLAALGLGVGVVIYLGRKHEMLTQLGLRQAEMLRQAQMRRQAEMREQADMRRQGEMREQADMRELRSSAPHSASLASNATLSQPSRRRE